MEPASSYQLKQGDEDYIFSIILIESGVKLSCEDTKGQIYSKEYSLENIKSIDEIFSKAETNFDIVEVFDNILRNEKVRADEEGGAIQILLFIESENRQIKILLSKEGAEIGQEIKEVAYDENQIMNQIGENIDINVNNNYNIQEGNLETYNETNIDTNIIQQNEITNTAEEFNMEEFLKGTTETTTTQNELNNINTDININTNIDTNNLEENNYFQNTEESTSNINLNINTEATTSQVQQDQNKYSLPYISPADEEQTNIANIQNQNVDYTNQITTTTTTETNMYQETQTTLEKNLPKVSQYHKVAISLPKEKSKEEIRISKLTDEQNLLKNQHSQFNIKITELTNLINSYKSQISLLQSQKGSGELDSLRAENQKIRQQLMELGKLRKELAEAESLKNQLSEIKSLRQKAAEVDSIKSQLLELNNLKMKIAQLNGIKDRLNELNQLKSEINRLNQLNKIRSETKLVETTKTTRSIIKGDIIHNLNELEMLTRKINNSNNKITLNLLYKATADGDTAEAFHQKCDQAESSLVLVETDKGKRFGGFTSNNWRGDGEDKMDPKAFVFSLDKMTVYDNIPEEEAIGCYPKFGPIFLGCQIRIFDHAFEKGGTTFEKGANYETEENFELSGGEQHFRIKEIEVYEVIVE